MRLVTLWVGILAIAALCVSLAMAQVQVPYECAELAAKHGYPPVLQTERQIVKALAHIETLAIVNRRDAAIQSCAQRARAMLAEWRQSKRNEARK